MRWLPTSDGGMHGHARMRRPALGRGLSAKLLLLTIAFVLLGEVLIYIPSIARVRLTYLQERIAAAHLATLALPPTPSRPLDTDTEDMLLRHSGVLSIQVHGARGNIVLGQITPVDRVFDLREANWFDLVVDALAMLWHRGERLIRVVDDSPQETGTVVDIILPEAPMWVASVRYSMRILGLSVGLSLLVAGLLFFSLQQMIVQPLRRVTEELAAFRERPEDSTADGTVPPRGDEIGIVEQALADMRAGLRQALAEKTRLAALGAAMSRVSHDIKNILTTGVLIADRLEHNADPTVRRLASRLVETLDRAARLCSETLNYARSGPPSPVLQPTNLLELVRRVQGVLGDGHANIDWQLDIPEDLELLVDPDQLDRVFLNLAQNAIEAINGAPGEISIAARPARDRLRITMADTGPGIPERVRARLFEPFAGSAKPAGSGLGLAICRELLRAHGGDIELLETSAAGTIFELRLPARAILRGVGTRRSAMSLKTVARLVLPLALLLGGCGVQGPGLPGYPEPGLQFKVISFYDRLAMERNATCPQPRMQAITRAQIIDETPQNVVMNIRYHWFDEGQIDTDDSGLVRPFPALQRCNGWGERTFTFVKRTDGTLDVQAMTGEQRRR